ncbi:DUF1345 domain-containing protein [Leucobacter sp. HY1910]
MAQLSIRSRARLRALISIFAGLAAGFGVSITEDLATSIVAGWGVFALVNVVWGLMRLWPMDAKRTQEHAVAEDPGRNLSDTVSVVGSIVSLAAVALVIADSQASHNPKHEYMLAAIAVLSVSTSWALIQFNYMLRYARVYYAPAAGDTKPRCAPGDTGVTGGIVFNQQEPPEYTDFIYFAIGLGMTYQVADTNVTSNQVRRIVIGHTVLAFLFATVILATIVNLVTSIGS